VSIMTPPSQIEEDKETKVEPISHQRYRITFEDAMPLVSMRQLLTIIHFFYVIIARRSNLHWPLQNL
jgi:hypothetical protein